MNLSFDVDTEGLPSSYLRKHNALMTRLGLEVIARIKKRTLAGLDANGKPLGRYKNGGGAINLHDTGAMLDSMFVKRTRDNGFELSIGTDYARYVTKNYNFFAMSSSDVAFVADEIEAMFFDHVLGPAPRRKKRRRS